MSNPTPDNAGWLLDDYDSERFWGRVNFHGGKPYLDDPISNLTADAGECWAWTGGNSTYGRFELYNRWMPAHKVGLQEFGVKVPEGHDVDHLCRNTICVRHNHLEAVTHKVNMERGARALRTECVHGHEYTEENTYWMSRKGTRVRYCRICLEASRRKTYLRQKQK